MDCIETANLVPLIVEGNNGGAIVDDISLTFNIYTRTVDIFNLTQYPIGIAERSGRKYHFNVHPGRMKSGKGTQPGVYIRTRETIPAEAKADVLSMGLLDEFEANFRLKLSKEAYQPHPNRPTNMSDTSPGQLNTMEVISQQKLDGVESFYHRDLDIVIVRLRQNFQPVDIDAQIPDHPYSRRALGRRIFNNVESEIDLIDGEARLAGLPAFDAAGNSIGSKFICELKLIDGETSRYSRAYVRTPSKDGSKPEISVLQAFKNETVPAGLYVKTNRREHGLSLDKRIEYHHLTDPESFKQYNVYLDLNEAQTRDAVTLERMKIENRLREIEVEDKRTAEEAERLKLTIELNRGKHLFETQKQADATVQHERDVQIYKLKADQFQNDLVLSGLKNKQDIRSIHEKVVADQSRAEIDAERNRQANIELQQKLLVIESESRRFEKEEQFVKIKFENEQKRESKEGKSLWWRTLGEILKNIALIIGSAFGLSKVLGPFMKTTPALV